MVLTVLLVALVEAALEYLLVIGLVAQEHLDKVITEAVVHLLVVFMVAVVEVVLRLLEQMEQVLREAMVALEPHLQLLAHL